MEREKINWKEIIKEDNIVKVREWDDMAKEFGEFRVSLDGTTINCFLTFTEEMRKHCGEEIRINKDMEKDFNFHEVFCYEGHMFSTDMLEPYMIIEKEKECLFMKIQEVMELKDGSRVRANNGKIYIVENGNLISEDNGNSLIVNYGLKEIFNMEFELIKVKLVDVLIPGNIVEIMDCYNCKKELGVILNNSNICYFNGGFDSLNSMKCLPDCNYYINKVYEPLIGFDLMNIKKEKMKLVWSKN